MDDSGTNGFLTSLQGVYPPNYSNSSNQYQGYSAPDVPSIEYFRPTNSNNVHENRDSFQTGYYQHGKFLNGPNDPVMPQTHHDQSLSSLLQTKDSQYVPDKNNYYNHTTDYYHPVGTYGNQLTDNSWNYNTGYYDNAWTYYDNYDYYYNSQSYDYAISYENQAYENQEPYTYHSLPEFHQSYEPNQVEPNVNIQEKKTYDCTKCDQKFEHHYLFVRHMKRKDHLNQKDFKCKICNKRFAMAYNLTRHYSSVHKKPSNEEVVEDVPCKGLPTIAAIINENTGSASNASTVISSLKQNFECSVCNEVMTTYIQWRRHMVDVHSEGKKYICPHKPCQNHFEHLDMLLDHVKKHKTINTGPSTKHLRCTKCKKEFSRPGALKRHWLMHNKEAHILCPFKKSLNCNMTFYRMDALKRHLETHKDGKIVKTCKNGKNKKVKDNKMKFQCDKCSISCRSLEALNKHQESTHTIPTVQCEYCAKGFKNQHGLNIHACPKKQRKTKKGKPIKEKKEKFKKTNQSDKD